MRMRVKWNFVDIVDEASSVAILLLVLLCVDNWDMVINETLCRLCSARLSILYCVMLVGGAADIIHIQNPKKVLFTLKPVHCVGTEARLANCPQDSKTCLVRGASVGVLQ